MAIVTTITTMVAISKKEKVKLKIFRFKSSDMSYLVHARDEYDAMDEAKKITILHNIEWDCIEELDDSGKVAQTIVQKIQNNSIKTIKLK